MFNDIFVPYFQLLLQLYLDFKHHTTTSLCSALHFVETHPSVFDEISPFLKAVQYKKVFLFAQHEHGRNIFPFFAGREFKVDLSECKRDF